MSWLVEWDRERAAAPSPLLPEGLPPSLELCRVGSSWVLFEGHLLRPAPLTPRGDEGAAACLMRAYREGGLEALDGLRGSYTFALWDADRGRLFAERDALGFGCCFYARQGEKVWLAPSLDDLLLAAPRRGLRRVVLAEYVSGYQTEEHLEETLFEGVQRVLPGQRAVLRRSAMSLEEVWEPIGEELVWASEEEAAGFEGMLQQAVDRALGAGADTLALSGGFDSVGLAALAARSPALRAPLQAVCLRFIEESCDEEPTQRAVTEALGMPLLLREAKVEEAFVETSLEDWVATSSPSLSIFQALYSALFEDAREVGGRHLMTGTGGDELLLVGPSWGADRLLRGDLPGLLRLYLNHRRSSPVGYRTARQVLWIGGLRALLADAARRSLSRYWPQGLERWRRRSPRPIVISDPALRRAMSERRRRMEQSPVPPEGRFVSDRRSLFRSPLVMLERDQTWSWARSHGFTLSFPFYDRDLVELLLRVHPDHLLKGGFSKAPLRAMVRRLLPDAPMSKRKIDFTKGAARLMRGPGQRAWRSLGGPRLLADELGILDRERTERFMRSFFSGESPAAYPAWILLSTERWLQALVAQGKV